MEPTQTNILNRLFLLFLLFTGIVNAQILNIPDANFKAALLNYSPAIDTNSDGNIEISEVQALTDLSLSSLHISDLTGIQSFTNLTYLNCSDNDLTTIDLSGMANLTNLFAGSNPLTSINLTGLTQNFGTIDISNNQMTSLVINGGTFGVFDCSGGTLTALSVNGVLCGSLKCNNNQLAALNMSNSIIHELYCMGNQLTSLDLSNVIIDNTLSCADNQITILDMANQNMATFLCSNNLLTSLDVSNMTYLTFFACVGNPLTYLNLKNGISSISDFSLIPNSPTLQYICANEEDVPQILASANAATVVGTYCSFNPGGNYNTISGNIRLDLDNNGCDAGDILPQHLKVVINDGTGSGATFINADGNYNFYTHSGSFTLNPVSENAAYFNISPATATVGFPLENSSVQVQDFCMTASGVHPDLEIILTPLGAARPGFDAFYRIVYRNKGNQTMSGSIDLTYDDAHTSFTQAIPASDNQSANTLLWNFSNLQPFEAREILLTLHINSSVDSLPVNSGDTLHFSAAINFVEGDETPDDNFMELAQIAVNAYDPNEKSCLEGTTVTPENIGKYLHYNINLKTPELQTL